MRGPQLITEWNHEIVYDNTQLAWFADNCWYCDPDKEMNVVYEPVPVLNEAAPNVIG